VFGAASAAALALLTKIEFGVGAYVAVLTLLAGRALQQPSRRRIALDVLAVLPSAAACVATVAWMISLRGTEFLVQENLMGLPSTYFMQRYGDLWVHKMGLRFDGAALGMSVFAILWWVTVRLAIRRYGARLGVLVTVLGVALALKSVSMKMGVPSLVGEAIFLPPALVFLIIAAIPVLLILVWRNRSSQGFLGLLAVVVGSGVAAGRTLFLTSDNGYSIYYNGAPILSFLLLASWIAFAKTPGLALRARPAEVLPFLALVIVVCKPALLGVLADRHNSKLLMSDRGMVYLPAGLADDHLSATPVTYGHVIQFMKAATRRGESVLSVPEDTSLYFFSGAHCPTRVFEFTPGLVAPGKMMHELIDQIENKQVRYLIWSNRSFSEYGVPEFGKDYDQPLGDYFRAHYRPVGSFGNDREWKATIWERKEVEKTE
jgi:hypothetical protein